MKTLKKLLLIVIFLGTSQIYGQDVVESVHLQGPRIGLTYLPGSIAKWINEETTQNEVPKSAEMGMIVTQFGWQFEDRFIQFESGGSLVLETVLLVGGLERSLFLPSATFLIGSRNKNGTEFGIGPNLSIGGVGLAASIGVTHKKENAFIPVNFAIASSNKGVRFSLLMGFNARKR